MPKDKEVPIMGHLNIFLDINWLKESINDQSYKAEEIVRDVMEQNEECNFSQSAVVAKSVKTKLERPLCQKFF